MAALSCSRLNSLKVGEEFRSLLPPFSRSEDSRTEGLRWDWNQQRENLEQRAPIWQGKDRTVKNEMGVRYQTVFIGPKLTGQSFVQGAPKLTGREDGDSGIPRSSISLSVYKSLPEAAVIMGINHSSLILFKEKSIPFSSCV